MAIADDLFEACLELDLALSETKNEEERKEKIVEHLTKICSKDGIAPVYDLFKGLQWVNTTTPLSHSELGRKLVVLDFFTYCCINCMHILPDLKVLEETFTIKDGCVVVGVHSAKFQNEKALVNIASAIQRYGITHPVVNDSEMTIWKALGISCWPTILILSPESGLPIFIIVGEGHREKLFLYVSCALEFFKSQEKLSFSSIPAISSSFKTKGSVLRFPGKISASPCSDLFAISDTGSNRILIIDDKGFVKFCVGNGKAGWKDGEISQAEFDSPQGTSWLGDKLIYVADTNNHLIRLVDLNTLTVSTVIGTGRQGHDKLGGKPGIQQSINSPWDVAVVSSTNSEVMDLLFIAMAGSHQIWVYFILDSENWLQGSEIPKDTCMCFAGSGLEENKNNSYRSRAGFAQPSDITVASNGEDLYVADSESSSIRRIRTSNGAVSAVVGGAKDPTNLFAFGDVDGTGVGAKLQHPMGVAWHSKTNELYIADSYNHKIKLVDPESKTCTTVIGNGTAGNKYGINLLDSQLNEPGGLCIKNDNLYICDTNNHSIKVYDLAAKKLHELGILFVASNKSHGDQEDVTDGCEMKYNIDKIQHSTITQHAQFVEASPGGWLHTELTIELGECYLTEGAPSNWNIECPGNPAILNNSSLAGDILKDKINIKVGFRPDCKAGTSCSLFLHINLYYCSTDGCCHMKFETFEIPIRLRTDLANMDALTKLTFAV